jgi:predicted membrane protein
MSGTLLQVIGILAVIALVATMLTRPAGVLAMVLAAGVVVAAIVVTWNQVETYQTLKAANSAAIQPQAAAGATMPPAPSPAPAGG